MSDAYKQIRVEVGDVWKTAFATTLGIFIGLIEMSSEFIQSGLLALTTVI